MKDKHLKVIWLFASAVLFVFLFLLLRQTFFFHDEWTFLYKIINSPVNFLFTPHNEHFMPVFNIIYLAEYKLFGLNYTYYQLILLVFHFATAWILYKISKEITQNESLSVAAFFFFLLNSIYWEVIFSVSTLPVILCTFLMGLAILAHMKYHQAHKSGYLLLAAFLAGLSGFAWGAGLLFPVFLLVLVVVRSERKGKTMVKEGVVFLAVQALSLLAYRYFSPKSAMVFDVQKIATFFAIAVKWLVVSFYTASPGLNKLFLATTVFLSVIVFPVLVDVKTRKATLKRAKRQLGMILFLPAIMSYLYLISAISRYRIDIALAKSSRYTYIPVFFFIILNTLVVSFFWAELSKVKKSLLIIYLVVLSVANIYFFKIYYQSWMETISKPNEAIFWKIARSSSEKEREKIVIPSTFHDFYKPQQIYFILCAYENRPACRTDEANK